MTLEEQKLENARIDALVAERAEARRVKNYIRANEIREQLLSLKSGSYRIKILDERDGSTFWYWSLDHGQQRIS